MAKLYGDLPLRKKYINILILLQSLIEVVYFFIGIAILTFSFVLCACEGSRTDRMIKATERAVNDYNNGDSSSLIMLIVGVIALGALWLLGKWIDSKK